MALREIDKRRLSGSTKRACMKENKSYGNNYWKQYAELMAKLLTGEFEKVAARLEEEGLKPHTIKWRIRNCELCIKSAKEFGVINMKFGFSTELKKEGLWTAIINFFCFYIAKLKIYYEKKIIS